MTMKKMYNWDSESVISNLTYFVALVATVYFILVLSENVTIHTDGKKQMTLAPVLTQHATKGGYQLPKLTDTPTPDLQTPYTVVTIHNVECKNKESVSNADFIRIDLSPNKTCDFTGKTHTVEL